MKKRGMFFLGLLGVTIFVTPAKAQVGEILSRIGERISLSGYAETHFIDRQDAARGSRRDFSLHCIAVDINAAIWKNTLFSAELLTRPDSSIKDEPYFLYAYFDYTFNDLAILRLGRFLVPWGKFNQLHDPPHRDLHSFPLIQQYLSPLQWNEQGVQLYGQGSAGGDALWTYAVYLTNGINETRVNTPQYPFPPSGGDNNDSPAIGGNFRYLPFKEIDIGISGYYGKWDDANNKDLTRFSVDFNYNYFKNYGPFSLKFEYMWSEVKDTPTDYNQDGFLVEAAYKFLEQGDSYWIAALRYGEMDKNDTVKDSWDRKRMTVGLIYSPIPPLKFQAEYSWVDTEQSGYDPNSAEIAVTWQF